ncbi:MAG: A/G-specific adenine glycosylase [Myxococcales bacterium]|nr:A/G-specific adenine glycosylase [Myxococcales bacterium]
MIAIPEKKDAEALSAALLRWFDAHARELPWRGSRDPYAIWVSEIMLQQTRVETVKAFYGRFLERFPTIRALAAAPTADVLSAWAGLGYYRRARAMHAAAREVDERHGGAIPRTAKGLSDLPGVGAYTAGAVASIAFGERASAVDGNVARVLCRLFALEVPIGTAQAARKLAPLADALVPADRPGDHNQAMMELGATVCTPRSPACSSCPLADVCVARRAGRENDLPIVTKKREAPVVRLTAAIAGEGKGRGFVLARRPYDGLYGGLWEPPMTEATGPRAKKTLLAGGLELGADLGSVRHVLTHRVLDVSVKRARIRAPLRPIPPYEEVAVAEPSGSRGLSTLARKILELAEC